MPRNREELEASAAAAADRLEALTDEEIDRWEWKDAGPLRDINQALVEVAAANTRLHDTVTVARGLGFSWANIGVALGTSGESARQRHGTPTSVA